MVYVLPAPVWPYATAALQLCVVRECQALGLIIYYSGVLQRIRERPILLSSETAKGRWRNTISRYKQGIERAVDSGSAACISF